MNKRKNGAMIVAGLMSGTSADGIDVAIARIGPRRGLQPDDPANLSLKLLGHAGFRFAPALRRAVLAAMDARATSTAELARLNWRLGQAYAEALGAARNKFPFRLDLVGCHGQTIYHQPKAAAYAGRPVACTWQIGEMAMLAEAHGVPVISNFRPADMVAGGEGAPLVPLLDFVVFRHASKGRVLQNIGGIANLTVLPPGATLGQLCAFDTGPGNMVIDALMQRLYGEEFDRNGAIARSGAVLDDVVEAALRERFFRLAPPKSAGREQFGSDYAERFLAACRAASGKKRLQPQDAIASATALTARSIARAYVDFVGPQMGGARVEYIVAGGGTRNRTLIAMLSKELEPLGCTLMNSDRFGLPAEAKEAAAFALLAYQTWHRRPGNVPAATGARRPAILGGSTHA
ncbi:MAG TPA: anhydro-N-acetylmuramic acid kinase [Acidobacteriaceae bacterium]|nr:anhydro-N-acetylmuramic acid kinase [Acidobacteriaceae bacterium]